MVDTFRLLHADFSLTVHDSFMSVPCFRHCANQQPGKPTTMTILRQMTDRSPAVMLQSDSEPWQWPAPSPVSQLLSRRPLAGVGGQSSGYQEDDDVEKGRLHA